MPNVIYKGKGETQRIHDRAKPSGGHGHKTEVHHKTITTVHHGQNGTMGGPLGPLYSGDQLVEKGK